MDIAQPSIEASIVNATRSARPEPSEGEIEIRSSRSSEREALLTWLNAGLRPGRSGRLEGEIPVALDPSAVRDHVVAVAGDRFLAHAFSRRLTVHARGLHLPVGLVGLVYTDPSARGRGLATRCVEHCVERLSRDGAMLVALWSSLEGFYERLGFEWAGRDSLYVMDRPVCQRAIASVATAASGVPEVGEATPDDLAAIELLHHGRPVGAERASGELARMVTAPACVTLVARREGRPIATASLGRGDDFADVVHEWAGEPGGVLACLERLVTSRDAIGLLAGPSDHPILRALRRAGAGVHDRPFALVRVTDPEGLWRRLSVGQPSLADRVLVAEGDRLVLESRIGGARQSWSQSRRDALDLLFGRGLEEGADAPLTPDERKALAKALPWPLYLWGFDSI